MTDQKRKHLKKGWIIAAAAVLLVLCALLTANAATGGAIFDGTLFRSLRVRLNGEEYRLEDYEVLREQTVDEDGLTVEHYAYALPGGNSIDAYAGESYTAFSVDTDADTVQIVGDDADSGESVTEP